MNVVYFRENNWYALSWLKKKKEGKNNLKTFHGDYLRQPFHALYDDNLHSALHLHVTLVKFQGYSHSGIIRIKLMIDYLTRV